MHITQQEQHNIFNDISFNTLPLLNGPITEGKSSQGICIDALQDFKVQIISLIAFQ